MRLRLLVSRSDRSLLMIATMISFGRSPMLAWEGGVDDILNVATMWKEHWCAARVSSFYTEKMISATTHPRDQHRSLGYGFARVALALYPFRAALRSWQLYNSAVGA